MLSMFPIALLLVLALVPQDGAGSSGGAPQYDVFEFGFHGPTWTTGVRMNPELHVTGSFGAGPNEFIQAFVGRNTSFLELDHIPGYGRAAGIAIDSRRRIALRMYHGQIYQLGLDQHVGSWTRDTGSIDVHVTFLGEGGKQAFGGTAPDKSDVYDSNENGDFVGWLSLGTQLFQPLLGSYKAYRANLDARTVDVLPVPPGLGPSFQDAWARAVDPYGDVVGLAYERVVVGSLVIFQPTAVAWIGDAPIAVGSPDPIAKPFSSFIDMDGSGRAIGTASIYLSDPSTSLAFAWHKHSGATEWLRPVAGYTGSTVGMCALGLTAGSSYKWEPSQGAMHSVPTVWIGTEPHALAELARRAEPWALLGVHDIDDVGRMLALAHQPGSGPELHNVLLVPRSGLDVELPAVGLTGHVNTVRVHGATPGARVELLVGLAPTVAELEGCSNPYAIVGVAGRRLQVPAAIADAGGTVHFEFVAPAYFGAVSSVYFQPIEPDNCRTGAVRTTFFF